MKKAFLILLFALFFTPLSAQEAKRECLDFPILFAQRHNYQGLHIYDTFYQWRRGGTSGIYVLENPADPPEKHRIRAIIDPNTPNTLGDGNYFDPSLSFDAKKLLFCYKATPDGCSAIYEIGVDGTGLRQLTNADATSATSEVSVLPSPYFGKGSGHHDVRPAYLPDGRIVFTSTRYSGLVPCANNGVAILHVMNGDGSGIHTISVNNVTEFDPTILPDGRILFGRWEYIDKNALTIQSLWSVYPDGTNETAFFANNMVFPEAILQAKPVPGAENLVVGTFAPHNAPPRGTIAMIDIAAGKQNSVAGKNDVNAIYNFEHPDNPTFDRGQSCDPWALNENIVLYSGQMKNATNDGKFNSILLRDRNGNCVEILSSANIDLHNPSPLLPRTVPPVLSDQTDRSQKFGSFYVMDVYQGMPSVPRGTVKWLRVLEETSRVSASPGANTLNQTFSISAALAWSEKIYHGIVPVSADGSVHFRAPSGRALYFQLLDENYRLVRGMRTFVQAAPGTVRSCTGCHEYGPPKGMRVSQSNGQKMLELRPESWGTGYMDYPSMIQPIFDQKCVRCHGGPEGIAAGLDLSGAPTEWFNISYVNLTSRRERVYWADLISGICCMNGTAYFSCSILPPYSHGSGNAPLADRVLKDDIHKNLLTTTERELLFAWLDSNGLYFGTWNYTTAGPQLRPWALARDEIRQILAESRCARCHANEQGKISRFENDWINLDNPEMSRLLRAPMAASQTAPFGLGVCRDRKFDSKYLRLGLLSDGQYVHQVRDLESYPTQTWVPTPTEGAAVVSFANTEDPLYQRILKVIQQAQFRARLAPRIDMPQAGENGSEIIAGRFRQILPTSLPQVLPPVDIRLDAGGNPVLTWPHTADLLGLSFEIHRSDRPKFEISEKTRVGQTELFRYTDRHAPAGKCYYALVLVSGVECACARTEKSMPVYLPEVEVQTRAREETQEGLDIAEIDLTSGFCPIPGNLRFNPQDGMKITLDVRFDEPGQMPVVLGYGLWNGPGWFLQKFQGRWRFYIADTNCDSSVDVPLNRWVHVEITYQNGDVKLYQDGILVAQRKCPHPPAPWNGDLLVGQYSNATDPAFSMVGAVKNLKIR